MALGILAATSLFAAKETRSARKDAQSRYAADKAEQAKEEKKMEADIATQEAEQKKDLERQKTKDTRRAKRGAGGYAGTVLTRGVAANADATRRATLGVG